MVVHTVTGAQGTTNSEEIRGPHTALLAAQGGDHAAPTEEVIAGGSRCMGQSRNGGCTAQRS